ncbi:MAG: hypothetical protein K2G80_07160 [Bacteroidales bacterium]|nr:hypothetical protein [Bacteroidales bacterium]
MKKIFLVIVLVVCGFALHSQNKGEMYVSGIISSVGGKVEKLRFTQSGNFSPHQYNETIRSTPELTFTPEFGYFVADKCALRGSLSYGYERVKTHIIADEVETLSYDYTHSFSFKSGLSYYARICRKFYYRPGLCVSFGFNREISMSDEDTHIQTPFIFGISFEPAAFEVKPTDHFGFMFRLFTCDLYFLRKKAALDMHFWAAAIGFQYYF